MGSLGTRISNTRATEEASVQHSRGIQQTVERATGSKRLVSTGISFTAPTTVADSGNGLTAFAVGDVIEVRGTASNNGTYTLDTVAAGTATVHETVVTESAGNSVELRRV